MINNEEIIVNVLEEDIIRVKGNEEIFEVGTQIIPVTAENDPIFIQSPAYGIASTDITNWNGKSDFSGNYNDLADKPTIPTELADLIDDSTHRVVTDTEKSTWNNKSDFSGNYNDLSNKPSIPTKTSDITNDSGFVTSEVSVGTTTPTGGEVWFKHSKNLFRNTLPTQTLNGLTITNNGDGSLTLNGTTTATTVLNFGNGIINIQNTPLYLDSHTTASGYVFCYYIYNANGTYKTNLNDKSSITLTNGEYIDSSNIFIASGATINNLTLYPQLTIGTSSTPFEAYVEPEIYVNHGNGYQKFL